MAKKVQCLQRDYKKGKKGVSSTLSARKLSLLKMYSTFLSRIPAVSSHFSFLLF